MPTNPHGANAPCNVYCQGDEHRILVTGRACYDDGSPIIGEHMVSAHWRFYAGRGWKLVAARQVEADSAALFTTMQAMTGVYRVIAGTTTIQTVEDQDPTHVAWMLTLRPLFEDAAPAREGT
jgi:hypothetical protein